MTNGLLKYGEIFAHSSYIRKPFLIYDFATAPLLKVPKCEIFDPFFFYTNKSYMGRWLEDWREKIFFSKTTADIRHFVFFTQAEPALKIYLRRLSLR